MKRWLLLSLLLPFLSFWAWLLKDLPKPVLPTEPSGFYSIRFYDRKGRLLYEAPGPHSGKYSPLPLAYIPLFIRQATIAAEDASFYSNPGFDPKGVLRAIIANIKGREIVMGGSTITQQVVRNFILSPEERAERTLRRKLREVILAWLLTMRYSKDEILAYYLNHTYYGNFAYGIQAAAEAYFNKKVEELSLAEGALLAGLPQCPSTCNPLQNPERAKARLKVVLDLMVKNGFITREEAQIAFNEELRFAPAPFPIQAPHFVFFAQEELKLLPLSHQTGTLHVYTTLDLDLQREAEEIIHRHLGRLAQEKPPHNVNNAALVAIDPATGEILTMVGNPDFFDPSISGAVNMALVPRQPGSAFKPITYAVALSKGYTPATMLLDVPTTFLTAEGKPYTPVNYDRKYHGPVSLREALGSSLNVPAVRVLHEVGVDEVLSLAKDLGITTLKDAERYGLSLTLGGGEVPLLELTAAYAAFANGGFRVTPFAIMRVENSMGQVLWENKPRIGPRVLDEKVAYLITHILADNEARILGFGWGSPLRLSRPAAAKTGTTTDWRDNWTVGYTPRLVAGVWVGNADHSPMYEVTGITGAAPIWHDFMERAHRGLTPQDFPRPQGIIEVEVCSLSGKLPSPYCPHRRKELFIAGTEPTETCPLHRLMRLDLITGLPASPSTPPERVVEKVVTIFPPEAQAWAREQGFPVFPPEMTWEEPLVIINPRPNSRYRLVSSVPREEQKAEIFVEAAFPLERVEVIIDGITVALMDNPPYRFMWALQEGKHKLWVLGYSGGKVFKSREVEFEVIPPLPQKP